MANQLSMAEVHSIETLLKSGTSRREIARLLGLDRETVRKYVARLQNQPNAPPGSAAGESAPAAVASSAPVDAPSGPPSTCEPFREQIVAMLERGLSARRIYQDLVSEHAFSAKYHSVRRFVARLVRKTDLPMRRMEVEPGAEAQIDLHEEAFDGHDKVMAKYLKPDLLILDDMGMKHLPKRLSTLLINRHGSLCIIAITLSAASRE